MSKENRRIKDAYKRRLENGDYDRWSLLSAYSMAVKCEREARFTEMVSKTGKKISEIRVLDVGCGRGDFLLFLLQLGVKPSNIHGVDLVESHILEAKVRLPDAVTLRTADLLDETEVIEKYDIVTCFVVFTSIVDNEYRRRFAGQIRALAKDDGLIVLYDFKYNNPGNSDVRKLTSSDVNGLFDGYSIRSNSLTVLPILGRYFVNKLGVKVYGILSSLKVLNSHNIYGIVRKSQ
jgi:2-polyprenyl-3-methyl-5-hydroxy-6-metoxy-1,4-benzoquinol methylase